ncbi:hypothetical protein L198_04295 [Cryptococcus wingfieldii CBS 7118]|uniref:Phosphoglycerate mutase n=1 Tax=Cryptococcus wingfieldii CBS 7118 TaxID=1295528 RepID=A0A1E3J6U4_9TREE|nr:hypothetical protein L198_04295 [Cryptococcus wingfieldii CBS 7118]ODN96579.1 hypothetical protein L198_04295 [Cryptococcus wingfieldii CBS 7118]
MRLILARHGQTDDNVRGVIQGHKDTPLNDWGRFESKRSAEALKKYQITEAYTSPLSRASETAQIALAHRSDIPICSHPGLKERCLGTLEGRRRKEGETAPADAESKGAVSIRMRHWLDKLLTSHTPPPPPLGATDQKGHFKDDTVILAVSHGGWLGVFLRTVISPAYHFRPGKGCNLDAPLMNASVTVIDCEYDQLEKKWKGVINVWADASHLKDVMEKEVTEVADDVR